MIGDPSTPDGPAQAVRDPERLDALRHSGLLRAGFDQHLDRLTRLATSVIGAPISMISMVDEDRQYFTSQHGLEASLAARRQTPLSHSVCQTVVATSAPVVLDDLGEDPAFASHPARRDLAMESYCGVPIRDPEGQVLGSFCVVDGERHVWTEQTIAILTELAGIVTDVIATGREYAKLVHDLQGRLLPDTLPAHPNGRLSGTYRPVLYSANVGGDFYDAFVQPDGGIDLVVCDVVGHGVTSTHAAAQLRAAARALLTGSALPPATVINRISQACADLPGCDTAAMLVAHVEPDGATVTWARAGAMPPMLTGPAARLLDGGASPPIGVGTCVQDPDCRVTLAPGEGLVLFTDGLVERRGEHLDIGFGRLRRASVEPDLPTLIEMSCPRDVQDDDIAVMSWVHDPA